MSIGSAGSRITITKLLHLMDYPSRCYFHDAQVTVLARTHSKGLPGHKYYHHAAYSNTTQYSSNTKELPWLPYSGSIVTYLNTQFHPMPRCAPRICRLPPQQNHTTRIDIPPHTASQTRSQTSKPAQPSHYPEGCSPPQTSR